MCMLWSFKTLRSFFLKGTRSYLEKLKKKCFPLKLDNFSTTINRMIFKINTYRLTIVLKYYSIGLIIINVDTEKD